MFATLDIFTLVAKEFSWFFERHNRHVLSYPCEAVLGRKAGDFLLLKTHKNLWKNEKQQQQKNP